MRVRSTAGAIQGNTAVVDALTGSEGKKRAHRIADFILAELGDDEAGKRMAKALKEAARAQAEAPQAGSDSASQQVGQLLNAAGM